MRCDPSSSSSSTKTTLLAFLDLLFFDDDDDEWDRTQELKGSGDKVELCGART